MFRNLTKIKNLKIKKKKRGNLTAKPLFISTGETTAASAGNNSVEVSVKKEIKN